MSEGAQRALTPDQRLRVFISSTLAELAPERLAHAIEELRLTPVTFATFAEHGIAGRERAATATLTRLPASCRRVR